MSASNRRSYALLPPRSKRREGPSWLDSDGDRGATGQVRRPERESAMTAGLFRWAKRGLVGLAIALATVMVVRIYDVERGPPLEPWHVHVPQELALDAIDGTDWAGYLAAEDRILDRVRRDVTQRLEPEDRVPINRYFDGSPVYPGQFDRDWNRSFVLEPEGSPAGVVVLLHGMTDSPYSMRHLAELYRRHGYVALAIRLPGHGTVPGGLTDVAWEDWLAATRLAVREARRRVPVPKPLHLVGYSNGGALAVKYALDALDDPRLAAPDRLVLISPMIGVSGFARFAWLADLPAIFPAFAKAAWLTVLPEFNPFKYNSFPVNGGRQSHRLTAALQQDILAKARMASWARLPPILAFQSMLDSTVSTRAVVSALYAHLPANGSELVLFDHNRAAILGPFFRSQADLRPDDILPAMPRRFRTTVVANVTPDTSEMEARSTEAGTTARQTAALGLAYPPGVYSLSHVALPFPVGDGLYGIDPDPTENFGIRLGTLAARGETGALVVSLDTLLRMNSNPFFAYLSGRIDQAIIAGRRDLATRP
jgi:alpha-beta hydrolase superfamily lysophospholipase